jgi:tRNA modification GTPase
MSDNIAAISTAFGEGAIAILRLSGPNVVAIADSIFRAPRPAATLPSRHQQLGAIYDNGTKLDDVLLSVHRAPHSYTGEDVVEIHCHGGVLITRRILELLLAKGARAADPGEFTRRAYLHGKMDLTQAEAVMDLIRAQSDLALRAATEQLAGALGERICGIREALLETLAHVEAHIDFPDEDIDPATGDALMAKLGAVAAQIDALLATAARGRVLREGISTVICGAPNVGKSSLLNLLLGFDRAIVSSRPGTTRDLIEEVINLRGIPLRLIDTAGLRESGDEVEQAGMARARAQMERADLLLHVHDASAPPDATELAANDMSRENVIVVLNKMDLGEDPAWRTVRGVRISSLERTGIDALEEAIAARIGAGETAQRDWRIAINARHKSCLETARSFVQHAIDGLREQISPELVAEEIRAALTAVGEVVGAVEADEVLAQIFATFCIGK